VSERVTLLKGIDEPAGDAIFEEYEQYAATDRYRQKEHCQMVVA
jgi:hypothetical protein